MSSKRAEEGSGPPPAEVAELLRTLLDSDGFDAHVLQWPTNTTRLAQIELAARDGACEDCLVGKEIMATLLVRRLGLGPDVEIDLIYPTDRRRSG